MRSIFNPLLLVIENYRILGLTLFHTKHILHTFTEIQTRNDSVISDLFLYNNNLISALKIARESGLENNIRFWGYEFSMVMATTGSLY